MSIEHFDIEEFLLDCKKVVLNYIKQQVNTFKCLKTSLHLYLMFKKYDEYEEKSFQTKNYLVLNYTNFKKTYKDIIDLLLNITQEFECSGSNWMFVGIKSMIITIVKCEYFGGSYVDLPLQIKNRKGCINIKNGGNDCFAYSIISALFPAKSNVSSKYSYPSYKKHLKFDGVNIPTPINDIPKFEKMNNLKINVYSYDKNYIIYPLYLSKKKKFEQIIHLLYFDNHFCWIKILSRLIYNVHKTRHEKLVCKNCSMTIVSKSVLNNHETNCGLEIELITPKDDEKILRFKNFKNKIESSLVLYGDFESLLRKYVIGLLDTTRDIYQEHLHLSVGYYLVSKINPSQSYYKSYIGT